MFIVRNIFKNGKKFMVRASTLRRFALYEKEFTVVPFCSVNITVPFNVTVVPLDVHKYKDCDKVIVKFKNVEESLTAKLRYSHDTENVNISTDSNDFPHNTVCMVEAPIKANVNITTGKGNIGLSNFNGESINLISKTGNISASRCHCDKISMRSVTGNITCTNVMQAAQIILETKEFGSITTDRLQGLVLIIETENGSIKTESSYCNSSIFKTETGHLDLRSAHKDCKVLVRQKGALKMTGFDGTLQAIVNDGDADVQLSRIQGDSEIKLEGNGSLKVKFSQTCLEDTSVKIISENIHIEEKLRQKTSNINGHVVLKPQNEDKTNILLQCHKGTVLVQSSLWMEMFNIKPPT